VNGRLAAYPAFAGDVSVFAFLSRLPALPRLRASLFYVLTYLSLVGGGLLFWPRWTLAALRATGPYDDVFPRVTGMLFVGLAMVLAAILVFRVRALYVGTIFVRFFFAVCTFCFWRLTGDPFFLVMLAIDGFGLLLSSTGLLIDLRVQRSAGASP
jgi:hypothetical protein